MNVFKSTSQHQRNLDSRTHPRGQGKKIAFATSLFALSFFAFSPAWAGDYGRAKTSSASIHLNGVSIQIGPGGFHLGIRAPYYGRAYGHYGRGYSRPHLHVRPFAKPYWKHQKRHGYRHHYGLSKRFGHRHGWKNFDRRHSWKNDRPRGNFRGKGGRGNGRHRWGSW